MRVLRLTLTVLAVIWAGEIRADEPRWPVDRAPSPLSAPFTLRADLLKDVPAEFLNDATACYLYSGTVHTLEPDGTVAATVTEAIRLNTRRAIDEFGEYRSIAFVPAYEKVTLHVARVRQADGQFVDLTPRHVHVRDVNTDHLVYDSSKQVVLSFPRLNVGDVIEVSWTTRGRHPEYQNQFFHRYSFGDEKYPVVRDEWTVRVPKSRELKHATIHGNVSVSVSDVGEHRIYSWTANNRPAPPLGERKPSGEESRWQAACTTFPSWKAVFDWERGVLAGRCDCPSDAKRLVADLTHNLPDETSKARALARFVRHNLRYLSRGEKHDYTPHSPSEVLRDRCGDCKDSANLLAIMMREAGLKAGVATLGPRGDGQVLESLPCPWGTHALTVVTIDGRDHWIDTTASRIGWNVLPHDDCDRVCFVTDPSGLRLTRTPKSIPEHDRTESTTKIKVASTGDAVGERVLRYSGIAAWMKREELAEKSKAEQRMVIAADLLEMFPQSQLTKLTFDAMDDVDAPLVVRTEFTTPELFSGDGPLEARFGDMTFMAEIMSVSANPERKAALKIGDPSEFISRFEIELPPVFRLSPGLEAESAKSRWCVWDLKVHYRADQPRKLEIHSHAVITASRVAVDDLSEWRGFQDALQVTFRVPVQIKVTRNPADIPLLEKACTASPEDARSAIALAELYLMDKKLPQARQLLEKARTATPDERKLWDLSLAAVEQLDDQERVYRLMMLRFPDDPKIAIELAQNLIDQDRPREAQNLLDPLTTHKQPAIRASARVELAHCSMSQEEPRKALRHLAQAAEADGGSLTPDAWFLKGQIHESLEEIKPALESYRRALETEEAADALEAATRMALALNQKSDALGYWRRLAVAAEGDPDALARTADLAIRLGRLDDAFEFANRTLTDKNSMPILAHRPMGLALLHRGQFEEAIQFLNRAEIDPEVLTALVQAQISLGRLSDAERQIARFNAIEPTKESKQTLDWIQSLSARRAALGPKVIAASANESSGTASLELAICAEALDARGLWPNQVSRLLQDALNQPQPAAPAFSLRAVLRMRRGDFADAMRDAERALALNSNDANALHVRGKVRLERGDKDGLADLELAAKLSSRKNAKVMHDLARAYAAANRMSDALSSQREAATLKPDDVAIREQLADIESLTKAQEKAPGGPGR